MKALKELRSGSYPSARVKLHWVTGRDANPCPEPEKGIRGPSNFFIYEYEVREYPKSFRQPRRTWFAVVNMRARILMSQIRLI